MVLTRAACLFVIHSLAAAPAASPGLRPITLHGKEGYINRQGQIVIAPVYKLAWGFSEGLASVIDASGKAGFIDMSGRFVIPPQFSYARPFDEGIAAVERVGQWGFIDKAGVFIANPAFEETQQFSDGLGGFKSGGKWGFLRIRLDVAVQRRPRGSFQKRRLRLYRQDRRRSHPVSFR
jgi:hypothetical protein